MDKVRVYRSGTQVEVDPTSLPAAAVGAKGAITKGASVAKVVDPNCDGKDEINGIIDSLREAGAIANTKFRLIYDANRPSNSYDDPSGISEDTAVYESGDTAEVGNWYAYLSGYTFKGWSTNKDASEPEYSYDEHNNYGTTYTVTFTNNDIVLYAIWGVRTYTVHYEAGGYGYGDVPADQVVEEGSTVYVSFDTTPTANNPNATFIGWKVGDYGSNDYEDAEYRSNGNTSFTIYNDVTLSAVFCEQYTITYSTGSPSYATGTVPSPQSGYNGQYVPLNFTDVSLTYDSDNTKSFIGWSLTQDDSSPTYEEVDNSQIRLYGDVTLYPVFGEVAVIADPTVTVDTSVLSYGEYVQLKVYYSMMNMYMSQGNFPDTSSPTPDTKTLSTANPYAFDLTNATAVTNATVSGTYKGAAINTTVPVITGNQFQALESPDGGEFWSFDTNDAVTITLLAIS